MLIIFGISTPDRQFGGQTETPEAIFQYQSQHNALEQTHLNLLVSETPGWGEDVTQHPHARGWERVSETQRCQKEERSKFIRSLLHYPRL